MRAGITILVLFLLGAGALSAQGFDWQYSARFPVKTPTTFVGAGASLDFALDQADLEFVEKATLCQSFKNGSGHFVGVFVRGEHWIRPERALFASLGYIAHSANFTKKETVPLSPWQNLESEYEFAPKLDYFTVEAGARERLFGSHFSAGVSLSASFLASHDFEFTERVLSPDDFPWQERTISNGQIKGLNSINISPKLFAAFDLSIANSWYADFSVGVSFPINDIADNHEWKRWSLSLGVVVFRGVK